MNELTAADIRLLLSCVKWAIVLPSQRHRIEGALTARLAKLSA